jgi:hypothetical protein
VQVQPAAQLGAAELGVGRLAIGISHDSYHSMLTSDNHFENY